jgi:septal ring factor EnvC (AmiA/AmiB activator)
VAGYGTTHPEDAREQRRRQLENEKVRIQRQLDQLAASRTQLEQAIAASDTEIERLRKKLDAADAAAIENAKTKEGASSETTPRATPSPSPYPPR